MSVERFRSVEEMPKPWRDPEDPENLRVVAEMIAFYHRFNLPQESRRPAVRHFKTLQELNVDRGDPYRTAKLR